MNLRSHRGALTAAALITVAVAGAGAGAGVYASFGSGGSTTVVSSTTVETRGQPVSATSGLTINDIYKRTYQGVVDITVQSTSNNSSFGFGGSQSQEAEGSGFVYDAKGDIVTNDHVVDGASSIIVKFSNGATYKAHVVGTDPSTDLALIKVSAPSSVLHPLTLGDSDALQVGDGVVAIGSPFGLPETVTSGIVSALHRQMTSPNNFTIDDSIQTDAAINHGNSGGPLIDTSGEVIGVNSQIQSDSGGSDGVGFAIPSNTVSSVASQLVAGKKVQHAYLGISVQDATTGTNAAAGAEAARVVSGTPAAKAGLQAGDVIVKLAGADITSAEDLSRVLATKKPGDTVSVTFRRGGSNHTVEVTLGSRPNS